MQRDLTEKIRQLAVTQGIDVIEFVRAEPFAGYAWQDSPRRDPHLTISDAQTIIIAGIDIGEVAVPSTADPTTGQLSRLILAGFYFDVVEPLQSIRQLLLEAGYQASVCDGYAQNSILPLKLAAVRAGIGWQGKNSLLVTRKYGSFLALGGIVTNAVLAYSKGQELAAGCGKCQACIEACPMGALQEPYKLNYEHCLSYLLEEEHLEDRTAAAMGNQILECDICQNACPWNKARLRKAQGQKPTAISRRSEDLQQFLKLANLFALTEAQFE